MTKPAKLNGLHRATEAEIPLGHREIKMLRPICAECAPNTAKAGIGWWLNCPHDPYIGERGVVETKTEYETREDGTRIIAGTTSQTVLRPWPNYVGVALVDRINSGRGPEYKRVLNGYILPSELRCSAFPNGIADSCEFRECYWQDDLKKYVSGTFCQEVESVIAYEDAHGITQEVHNRQIRTEQFESSRAKVKAAS